MASEKEMTLQLRIQARGEQALAELRHFEHGMNGIFSGMQRKAGVVGGTFRAIGGIGGALLAPLKYAAIAGGALAGVMTALGVKALTAGASQEHVILRLAEVTGSLESARKQWDMLEATSRRGPFDADDLAEAWIMLNHIGMASRKNLGILASTARVAGTNVQGMAESVAALQMRALKGFGIEFETKGEGYELKYYDKLRRLQKTTYKDMAEAQKGLMDFFGQRFGSGFDPKGLSEAWAMLKNNLASMWSTIGTPMLGAADSFVRRISDGMKSWIEGGGAEELGKKTAGFLDRGLNNLMALVEVLPGAMAALRGTMEGTGANFGTLLTEGSASAARIFMVALVEYFGLLKDVVVGLAKTMAAVFMGALVNLPGMGPARRIAGGRAYDTLVGTPGGDKTLDALAQKHLPAGAHPADLTNTPAGASALIEAAAGLHLQQGLAQMRGAIPGALSAIGATVSEEARHLNSKMRDLGGGYDFGAQFRAAKWRMADQAAMADTYQVTARMSEYAQEGDNPLRRHKSERDYYRLMSGAEAGNLSVGQRLPSGAVVVNIERLDVHASDSEKIMNDLIAQAVVAGAPGT